MQNNFRKFLALVSTSAAFWLTTGSNSFGQVSLTVNPPVISNTYTGFITLNITGLTNGQPVTVQTYLDLNGNGIIDAGEPLVDVFHIMDGGAKIIGGVTNINVPYDSNSATGAIATTLSFAPPLEDVVGQKIYRVVSNPPGAFTPVTAVLDITNAATGQTVSGIVSSNGVTPLPNAVVVALTVTNQNFVCASIADGSGHYILTLPPNAYFVMPTLPGYYADQSLLSPVILTNGASVTNNLTLNNGTVAISGTVYDAGNSNALGGVFLQAQSDHLFEVTFTDTNGNYTIGGTSNNWKIKVTAERLARSAYLAPQDNALTVDASLGNVTNANIGLYNGNALFYGNITISGTPVPNATVECNDSSQIFSGKGYSDANGNYAAAALVNTNVLGTNAMWFCSLSSGSVATLLASYIFNVLPDNVELTNGEAYRLDFVGLPVTATISGRLANNQGIAVSGVGVGAQANIGGNQYSTTYIDTDTNGNYSIGAANGQWGVNLNCCGSDGLNDTGYYDPIGIHNVGIPPTNAVVNIIVYPANLPQFGQPIHVSASQFNFNLYGANGFNYTVQTATNLSPASWSTITVVSNLPNSPYLIQDLQATNSIRFYRAFQGP